MGFVTSVQAGIIQSFAQFFNLMQAKVPFLVDYVLI